MKSTTRNLICCFALGVIPGVSAPFAQTASLSTAAYLRGMADARAAAKANDSVGAETVLVQLNRARPTTAAWHLETAQRLLQLANDLAREARSDRVPSLVGSALNHLSQADALSANARARGTARYLAGVACERYLGDMSSALSHYEAAVQLAPSNRSAKEALSQLESREANLRRKVGGN